MEGLQVRMAPPVDDGHVSVARLSGYWYIGCESDALDKAPMALELLGTPLVLFRDDQGVASALLDRCPHRNVPLSLGQVLPTGRLECSYHGWQFDRSGQCMEVPGLCTDRLVEGRRAPSYPVVEQDGFVWIYATPDARPTTRPFPLPHSSAAGYTTVTRMVEVEGTVHAAAENALDVPHTAYLHRGLFRGGKKNEIRAMVRRWHDRVECEYIGEPRPPGIAARILSPSGGEVQHWDRFYLPSVAQVEYRLGSENHFLVTTVMTPVSDFRTRMFAIISFNLRIPARLVLPVIEPLAMRIFRQDAEMLRIQTDAIRRFGGEQYMSTEIDVLGPHIWRLLKRAERDELEPADAPDLEREFKMLV